MFVQFSPAEFLRPHGCLVMLVRDTANVPLQNLLNKDLTDLLQISVPILMAVDMSGRELANFSQRTFTVTPVLPTKSTHLDIVRMS